MRALEIAIALADEIAAVTIVVLIPMLLAYKFNVVGLEEVIAVTIILLAIAAFIIYKVVEAHRREVRVGIETYIGKKATVVDVKGSKITIMVEGELWGAECVYSAELKPGDEVVIVGFEEGRFKVKPLTPH